MDPYVGEIRLVAFNFAPVGWLLCQGQTLPISGYDVLYALLGTTYGGDGQTTFNLPDLRGRAALHMGNSATGGSYSLGQLGGVEQVTLTPAQLPAHTHTVAANSTIEAASSGNSPAGMLFGAATEVKQYETSSNGVTGTLLSATNTGSGQPHENRMPFLTVNYIISTAGIFPSQS